MHPNVTLHSGGLSAVVFLPGASESYYRSSRFDHGTMVGNMKLGGHTVFGANFWRAPHDPTWTESGVGLASEFGCGEDGHLCGPGWGDSADNTSTNGVLGYAEANVGEPFLKIGVGALIKDSCPACGLTGGDDTYKFNSPYRFHERPVWKHHRLSESAIAMEHAASLPPSDLRGRVGYRVRHTTKLIGGSTLTLTTRLENTGEHIIRTPFYSHHLLAIDDRPTGPRLELALDLNLTAYNDCLPWAEPLADYFEHRPDSTWLSATREVAGKTRVKAIYTGASHHSVGAWEARYPGRLSVHVEQSGPLPLYAFSLYVEERTLSPEPIQMLTLAPGEATSVERTVRLTKLAGGAKEPTSGSVYNQPWAWAWRAASDHAGFDAPREQHPTRDGSRFVAHGRAGGMSTGAARGTLSVRAQPKR